MTIRLFDEIERSNTGPQLHSETDYAYLNRSARPDADRIRFVLEDWFSRYPKKKRVRLQERFRKNEYESAFFELYLHEIMLQQGFECQVEPIVESCEKRPDFLVFHQDRKCFYLEAIVPELPKCDARHDRHLRVFYDELDKIQSDFSFFVEVEGNLTKQPGLKNFKSRLEKLNPDELQEPMVIVLDGNGNIRSEKNDSDASLESIYEMDVEPKIIITISPKSTGQRGTQGNISGSFTGMRNVNTSNMICKAIKNKAGRYGELNLAFIIAINIKEILCDERMVANALFGEMVVCINRKTLGHSVDRDPRTAALRDPRGKPKNTRVSGIIILDNLNSWCIIQKSPELRHNPWASYPFPPELWQLSQWIPNKENGIYEKKDGKTPSELLRLSPNWPSS